MSLSETAAEVAGAMPYRLRISKSFKERTEIDGSVVQSTPREGDKNGDEMAICFGVSSRESEEVSATMFTWIFLFSFFAKPRGFFLLFLLTCSFMYKQ